MPDPLEPSTATRSPYQTSRSKGFISPVSSSCSQTTARLPVRPPFRRIFTCCSRGLRRRRAGLLELAEPGLRGLVLRRQAVVVLRLDLVAEHERLELGVLLVPSPAQLLEPEEPLSPGLVVGREATGVRPDRVAGRAELDGDHPGRGVVEQLAVVADEQDRLLRLVDPLLEPGLAGYVEEVVRLVEEQHLVGPPQQELQHQPLLLTAGEGGQLAILRPVEGQPERGSGADVPDHLDVVAPGVGPLRERRRVAHLGLLVVGLHQRELAGLDRGRGLPDPRRRHRQQQVGHVSSSPAPGPPSAA